VIDRIGELERRYVAEVLDGAFRSSAGSRMTARLEAAFAERFGARFAISFNNGTATMHAALVAAGVGPGDEVIVPPLTMASTTFAVLHAGAIPVFADVDPRTWTLDPAAVAAAITPRTRAMIPVALYGVPPDFKPLMDLAAAHDLFVLEDDAQCFLSEYHGALVGTIGHASSFSFQSSKHLTSGEGGMILTDDEELAHRIRRFGSLGYLAVAAGKARISRDDIQDPSYERHGEVGWNYRMAELCSAVALAQVERIDELVAPRVAAGAAFAEAVADCSWLVPQGLPTDSTNACWTYVLRLADEGPSWSDFRAAFLAEGGHPFYGAWQLTYLEPVFRGTTSEAGQVLNRGLCPVAEQLQPRLIQLKTNYLDPGEAAGQADALRRTVKRLGPG
jgi:perosamine synthetase